MSKISNEFINAALRNGMIVRPATSAKISDAVHLAAFVEMANLGFQVDPKDLEGFSEAFLSKVLTEMRSIIGADRDMVPVYPGFPRQVEELSTLTLLVEQILHYWSNGVLLPDYPSVVREGLPLVDVISDCRSLKVVSAGEAACTVMRKIVTDSVAISESDISFLRGCVELQHPDLELVGDIISSSVNGENVFHFLNAVNKVCGFSERELIEVVLPLCKSVDVVLRVVLTLFTEPAGDHLEDTYLLAVAHLNNRKARSVRMKKVPRPVRRLIVSRGASLSNGFYADNVVARQGLWRVIMRAVHPYDLKLSDAERRFADIIHSNIDYRTLNSLVEEAMSSGDVVSAVELLEENAPGNLLRRIVGLLRLVLDVSEVNVLADAVRRVGGAAALTTLISAYNGVKAANMGGSRVVRVAGANNRMVEREVALVDEEYIEMVSVALKDVIREKLKSVDSPVGPVGSVSDVPVPLVRRDSSVTDRVMDRGASFPVPDEGSIIRLFGHWNNNMSSSGYMDIGAVVLDDSFEQVGVCTWDSWQIAREWAVYSGDKNVSPGHSAAEYVDVKLDVLRKSFSSVRYLVMTLQSWSGFPIGDVDFIGGVMFRSDGMKGEVFDPRSVATAFKPTTDSLQSVLFVVDLETSQMIWLDSSNGSTRRGISSSRDESIGDVVRDEILRPRLTMGELATLWAEVHEVVTTSEPVDRETILSLL